MRLGEGEESSTHRKYIFIGHSEINSGSFSDDKYVAIINAQRVSDTLFRNGGGGGGGGFVEGEGR